MLSPSRAKRFHACEAGISPACGFHPFRKERLPLENRSITWIGTHFAPIKKRMLFPSRAKRFHACEAGNSPACGFHPFRKERLPLKNRSITWIEIRFAPIKKRMLFPSRAKRFHACEAGNSPACGFHPFRKERLSLKKPILTRIGFFWWERVGRCLLWQGGRLLGCRYLLPRRKSTP